MTNTMELERQTDEALVLGELEESLGFLLRVAQVQVYDLFYERFSASELRPGEFSVLWVIHKNPGVRQGLVASTLRIKPAHMTKIIRRFEEQGLLERSIPNHDRRSVYLTLTSEGGSFVEKMYPTFFGQESYHNHSLTPAEAKQLASLLRKYSGLQD